MNLWLFRHAKTSKHSDSGRDFDRELKPRGWRQCAQAGAWLAGRLGDDCRVLSSPAARAAQTARAALQAAGRDPGAVIFEASIYEAQPSDLARLIADSNAEELMLVGHNPSLEALQFALAAPDSPVTPAGLGTGCIARLEGDGPPAAGAWRLLEVFRPD